MNMPPNNRSEIDDLLREAFADANLVKTAEAIAAFMKHSVVPISGPASFFAKKAPTVELNQEKTNQTLPLLR